jgi:hypothetical protein
MMAIFGSLGELAPPWPLPLPKGWIGGKGQGRRDFELATSGLQGRFVTRRNPTTLDNSTSTDLTRPRLSRIDRSARTALAPSLSILAPRAVTDLQIGRFLRWSVRDSNPRPPACKAARC